VKKLEERDHLEDLDVDGRKMVIFKWISNNLQCNSHTSECAKLLHRRTDRRTDRAIFVDSQAGIKTPPKYTKYSSPEIFVNGNRYL